MRPTHRAAFGPRSAPNLVLKRVPPTRPRRTQSSRTRVGTGPRRAHRLRSTSPNCGTDPTTHRDATTTRRGTDSRSDRREKTRQVRPGTQPTRQPKPALPRATPGRREGVARLNRRAGIRAACPQMPLPGSLWPLSVPRRVACVLFLGAGWVECRGRVARWQTEVASLMRKNPHGGTPGPPII